MPKARVGGQVKYFPKNVWAQMQAQNQQPPQPQPAPPVQQAKVPVNAQQLWQDAKTQGTIDLTESGVTLADAQQMSDKDLHDLLLAITKQDLPDYLMPNNQQRFVYALGINGKPIVEDDATFAANSKGQTVIYNAQNSVNLGGYTLTADDIHDYIKYGDDTLQQNGIYGNGLYFSNSRTGSAGYGARQSKARLNPATARVVTMNQLRAEYDSWKVSHPMSQKALGYTKANNKGYGTNTYSQFALLRGYNVIAASQGSSETYYAVLDRSALIYSKSTKNSRGSNTW